MDHIQHRTNRVIQMLEDISLTEDIRFRFGRIFHMGLVRFQCGFELSDQALQVREDRIGYGRRIMAIRQSDLTIHGILRGRKNGRFGLLSVVAVLQLQECRIFGFGHFLDGVELGTLGIGFIGKSLIVHTEHDMGERVGFVLVLAGRVRLINHQRWFGREDTHIIDDEVISIIVSRHVIYLHAEVRIFLIHLDREIDLVPLVGLRQITGHIGGNIFPCGAIQRTLYGEREVRAGLAGFVSGISDEGGEVHLLSFAKGGVQLESGYLSRGRHTVAEDHISVSGTAVLLHLMPILTE